MTSTTLARFVAASLDAIAAGRIDFVFATPERLEDSGFLSTLRRGR